MTKVSIIKHSVNSGNEIVTFEIETHRYIWSEFMTHRLFSRNAASSRAIPIKKIMDMVEESPAMPTHWGINQSGMQAKAEHSDTVLCEDAWKIAARQAVSSMKSLNDMGLHKQIVNRISEPFQMIKAVVTATEWDNFFYLRDHPDAQPEIALLASMMWDELQKSTPDELVSNDWHLPYVSYTRDDEGFQVFCVNKDTKITKEDAIKVSASCCAQVSYRVLDDSLEKAIKIYDQLISSKPAHASPMEHQAMAPSNCHWINQFTHIDRDGCNWSGNFKNWVQYRQLIPGNVCKSYTK